MGAVVVIVLIVLVLLVGGAVAVRSISKDEAVHEEHVKSGGEYLRYRVPEGADPAAIVVALRHGGYDVVNDHELHGEELLISCPGGPTSTGPRCATCSATSRTSRASRTAR